MPREDDLIGREMMRQARPPVEGNRLAASTAGTLAASTVAPSTVVDTEGKVKRLWIPDVDPLDDEGYYLGDAPIGEF